MMVLIAGLALFILVHLVPTRPDLRANLVDRLGRGGYMGLFTLASFAALALIVWGFGQAQGMGRGNPQLWVPPLWTRHITFVLMIPALILLVAAYVPSHIRTAVKHPMLAAIKIWALAHLIANGDLASVLLFGSLLAYAVYDRISVKQRAALGPLGTARGGVRGDVIAVVAGLALYAFMLIYGHRWLIGVPLMA
jgi:uncharacterized membrane protein